MKNTFWNAQNDLNSMQSRELFYKNVCYYNNSSKVCQCTVSVLVPSLGNAPEIHKAKIFQVNKHIILKKVAVHAAIPN